MTELKGYGEPLYTFSVPEELQNVDWLQEANRSRIQFDQSGVLGSVTVTECPSLSYGTNQVVALRADQLPGRGFKFLSAGTAIAKLAADGQKEIVFATAGTYGIAAGIALKKNRGNGTAIIPVGSNKEKKESMEELGLRVIEKGQNVDESLNYAYEYAEKNNVTFLHPFADPGNIAGTGVLGLLAAELRSDVTHLITQYGGGSLSSGMLSVYNGLRPEVVKTVVQVAGCSPFVDSLRTGEIKDANDVDYSFRGGRSFFQKLGGVGVGKLNTMTLGLASRVTDEVSKVPMDHVYATMHDVQTDLGVLPEFAAAVGLESARRLARTMHVSKATILAVVTGAKPDQYRNGYLARLSARRKADEQFSRWGKF